MKNSKAVIIIAIGCGVLLCCLVSLILGYFAYDRLIKDRIIPTPTVEPTTYPDITLESAFELEVYYLGSEAAIDIGPGDYQFLSDCDTLSPGCTYFLLSTTDYMDMTSLLLEPDTKYLLTAELEKGTTETGTVYYIIKSTPDLFLEPYEDYDQPLSFSKYINAEAGISFSYPSNWIADEVYEGDWTVCEEITVTVTDGNYTFEYYKPCASGIAVCSYDESQANLEVPEYVQLDSYESVGGSTEFRRTFDASSNTWQICAYDEVTGNYLNAVGIGNVYYHTPSDPDPVKMQRLDDILQSMEEI